MNQLSKFQIIAYSLVGLGVFVLVLNSGLFGVLPSFIWMLLLFACGMAYWMWSEQRFVFWQRLLGFGLIGVFSIVTSDDFAGTAALGFPALGFGLVYARDRRQWWAVIPCGILASIGLLVAFEELFPRWDALPILFLGFAATFTTLYLRGGKRWSLFPAIVFIIVTVLVNDPGGSTPGWFLPFLLISSGFAMLWWWRRKS